LLASGAEILQTLRMDGRQLTVRTFSGRVHRIHQRLQQVQGVASEYPTWLI
jgi:hypothetical protein